MKTLLIVNPHAAGGRARRIFGQIEKKLVDTLGNFLVAVTERPEEVAVRLDAAAQADITRLIAFGGDGTNHVVLNALVKRPDLKMAFGTIPVGTGHDWSRALGEPGDPVKAVEWLARAEPVACDIGQAEYLDMRQGGKPARQIFLNISSAGVSGDIVARVNRARRRSSSTFLRATVATLLKYRPQRVRVECDGAIFYEGKSYLLVVANGRYFGRGMWVAPQALINDGLFDVLAVEGMSRPRILMALGTVFKGTHIKRQDVHMTHARSVFVHCLDGPLSVDLDGEEALGQDLRYTVLPGAVSILLDPSTAAVNPYQRMP